MILRFRHLLEIYGEISGFANCYSLDATIHNIRNCLKERKQGLHDGQQVGPGEEYPMGKMNRSIRCADEDLASEFH
ncbi:hypothetical protein B0G73_13662 [Paraburkholderia sp. BL25I1N1]|nr:hypothetical protein B0G73_13662 [Paraburkholderia sp. BL25I1N1]